VAAYDANGLPKYTVDMFADPRPEVPEERWITLRDGDLPCQIQVRLGRQQAGRLICTGMQVGAADGEEEYEVTKSMLRAIPWANVMTFIRDAVGGVSEWDWMTMRLGGHPSAGEAMGATAKRLSVRRGRKGLEEETLRGTAEAYAQAIAEGNTRPLAFVAVALDLDPSTVWRRLQNAWKRWPEMKPEKGGKP
jgi:hypothetical protein